MKCPLSMDQLGNIVVERVRELLRPTLPLSKSRLMERYLKTIRTIFSSTSDTSFMVYG
jgi:hypothetical protein